MSHTSRSVAFRSDRWRRTDAMIVTRQRLPRRTFLRGMGATLALPLLDGMIPAFATRAQAAPRGTPRFAVAYVPNGIQMEHWTPAATGSSLELTSTLEPLAPFRDRIMVVSGLA